MEQWRDKSGNNRHAVQTTDSERPTYQTNDFNSLPAVYFDGNDWLNLTATAANIAQNVSALTMVTVAKYVNETGGRVVFFASRSDSFISSRAMLCVGGNVLGTLWGYEVGGRRLEPNQYQAVSFQTTVDNKNVIQMGMLDYANAKARIFTDGVEQNGINFQSRGTTPNSPSLRVSVGGIATTYPMLGPIAEVIVYQKILSGPECDALFDYLASKWNLEANLPGTFATPPGSGQWTPKLLSGLALWLDAADTNSIKTNASGRVEFWHDKSGNGRHASQRTENLRPIYQPTGFDGTRPTLFFAGQIEGTDDFLSIAHAGPILRKVPGATLAAVVRYDDGYPVEYRRFAVFISTPEAAIQRAALCVDEASGVLGKYGYIAGGRQADDLSSGWAGTATSRGSYVPGTRMIQIGIMSHATGSTTEFTNGVQTVYSGTYGTNDTLSSDTDSFGATISGAPTHTNPLAGAVSEVVIYNRALDLTERQKLEGYLAHKWGLGLPPEHPYKDAPPSVAPVGTMVVVR